MQISFHRNRCHSFRSKRSSDSFLRNAFTLVEVLLVLAILAAIAAMVVPDLLSRQSKAQKDSVLISIKATEQALKMYAIDHAGRWARPEQAVALLMEDPGNDPQWSGPYLEKEPVDPWGFELRCRRIVADKPQLQVFSVGPDGKESSADDVMEIRKPRSVRQAKR